jgi:hypothetical protein
MTTRAFDKRLQKLEVRVAPSQPRFIRFLSVAPGGEITGEMVIHVGGTGNCRYRSDSEWRPYVMRTPEMEAAEVLARAYDRPGGAAARG